MSNNNYGSKENNSQENFPNIEDEEINRHHSIKRKDTRRWCKGKVGVEHTSVCMSYEEAKRVKDDVSMISAHHRGRWLVCTTCGKELAFYYPSKNRKKPDWVK